MSSSHENEKENQQHRIEILEVKVRLLELELIELKQSLSGQHSVQQQSTVSIPIHNSASRPADPNYTPLAEGINIKPEPPQVPPAPTPKPPTDWEQLLVRVWVPRIFIVVLLFGVLWGFTAAVSAGYITEPVRCFIGLAATAYMYWQGIRQMKAKRQALGQILLGGAVAILMLTVFAAHMLFSLLPYGTALIAYVISIGAGIFTSIRFQSQSLMIVTMLGGFLVPFLLDAPDTDVNLFIAYETLFSLSMMGLAYRFQHRTAFQVALWVLHLPLVLMVMFYTRVELQQPITIAILLQHAFIFVLSLLKKPRLQYVLHPAILLTSLSLTAGWQYVLNIDHNATLYTKGIAVLTAFYTITSIWMISQMKATHSHVSAAVFMWVLLLLDILDASYQAPSFLVFGCLLMYLGLQYPSKLQRYLGVFIYLVAAYSVITKSVSKIFSSESLGLLLLLVTMFFIERVLLRQPAANPTNRQKLSVILIWGNVLLLLNYLSVITNILTDPLAYDMQHLILSAVWAVFAIAIMMYGVKKNLSKVRIMGLVFLMLTLAKVVLIDLPDVSAFVRAILFIGLGSIGIAVSRFLYKDNDSNQTKHITK